VPRCLRAATRISPEAFSLPLVPRMACRCLRRHRLRSRSCQRTCVTDVCLTCPHSECEGRRSASHCASSATSHGCPRQPATKPCTRSHPEAITTPGRNAKWPRSGQTPAGLRSHRPVVLCPEVSTARAEDPGPPRARHGRRRGRASGRWGIVGGRRFRLRHLR
jgi:hypothetical protein